MVKLYAHKVVNGKVGRRVYLWQVTRQDMMRLERAGVIYTSCGKYTNLEFV